MAGSLKVRLAREVFVRSLRQLRYGSMELVCPGETLTFGDVNSDLRATIAVLDEEFFVRAITGGEIGLGESYMVGQWTSPDVPAVIRLGIRNLTLIEKSHPFLSAMARFKNEWMHRRHEVWDVTDPAKPNRLSVVVSDLRDTHKSWWECDTGIAFLVSGPPDWRTRRM